MERSPWEPSSPRAASVLHADRGGTVSQLSTDVVTTYPVESLTEYQREAFRQLLRVRKEDWLNIAEPIWFALILARERPAMAISTFRSKPDRDDLWMSVEDVLEAFDLEYQYWSEYCIDVARTSWRLDLLPTQETAYSAYHRRMECFYGYPEPDVEYFIQSGRRRIYTIRSPGTGGLDRRL